jgi:hypothetical protein
VAEDLLFEERKDRSNVNNVIWDGASHSRHCNELDRCNKKFGALGLINTPGVNCFAGSADDSGAMIRYRNYSAIRLFEV